MSERLYPTLTADGPLSTPASDDYSTLHQQITTELDKHLQETAEKREVEDDYFDGRHVSTNTSTPQQEAHLEDDDAINTEEASNPTKPESHEQDTSIHHDSPSNHQTQPQDELATIPEEEEEEEE